MIYDCKTKVARSLSISFRIVLSGETIFPITLTGDAGVISPGLPIGVGP